MGKEGPLKVSTGGMLKSDKKRHAVLKESIFKLFRDDKLANEVMSMDLIGASVKRVDKKKKKVIEIISGSKTLNLVPDDAEFAAWFTVLETAASGGAAAGRKLSVADFDLLHLVGKGSFGKVMQVRKKDNGQIYAMKVLSKKHIVLNNEIEHTKSERNILEKLNHPFLINLMYSFQTDDKLYFIMEFVNGGELFHHLQKEKRFAKPRVVFYAAEILLALEYLHSKGVVYRDLKPENLLLTDTGHVIMTDFGLCKEGMNSVDDRTGTFCGTPEYLAPEVLSGNGYNLSVDWWSYGSLVYEMLSGLPPFYSQDVQEMYRKIMTETLKFNDTIDASGQKLLGDLLTRDLSQRLVDPAKMKTYEFFADVDWEAIFNKEVEPPFIPPVAGKEDVSNVDDVFTDEKPSLELGDDMDDEGDIDPDDAHFKGFTFEAESAIGNAS